MRFPRLPSVAIAVLLLAATACVKEERPGVGLQSLPAEIVFGLNPPAAPGLTPALDLSQFTPDSGAPARPFIQPPPSGRVCPDATATDAPEKIASTVVGDQPQSGDYRWKARGTLALGGEGVPLVSQFQKRTIRDVTPVQESSVPVGGPAISDPIVTRTFGYTLRSELGLAGGAGFQDAIFQVRDNPLVVSQTAVNFGKPIVVGEPERGVVLKRSTVFRQGGGVVADFAPTPGILLLPLPVNPGEEWESVGIDPTNGVVMVLQGKVVKREAVDACGQLVDGWRVESQQTVVTLAGAVVANYDYVIATQLGGMLVYEHTFPPDASNLRLPSLPAIPGLPQLPGVPALPPLPPLPVPLPLTKDNVELTIGQILPGTPPN